MKNQNPNDQCACGSGNKYYNCCGKPNSNWVEYSVGERFPIETYLNGKEITVAILSELFFNVFVSFKNPTQKEIRDWTQGKLDVFLYQQSGIPFILFGLQGGATFDVNLNIQGLNKEQREKWLNKGSNLISMFLVNSKTGIIQGIRQIGIEFADSIREVCASQIHLAPLERTIDQILLQVNSAVMRQNAIQFQEFYAPRFSSPI